MKRMIFFTMICIIFQNLVAAMSCFPLHDAMNLGDIVKFESLLKSGQVDINRPDGNGCTPLFMAINFCRTGASEKLGFIADVLTTEQLRVIFDRCARLLLDYGADANLTYHPNHNTPLHDAVSQSSRAFIESLVKHGARVNAVNDKEETPLILAAQAGRNDIVALLLQYGANW